MTEQEWLAEADSWLMIRQLKGMASDRKMRLFAVARGRLFWHLLADKRSQTAVEVGERYADGLATNDELEAACGDALRALKTPSGRVAWAAVQSDHDPTGEGCWDTAWDLYAGAEPAEMAAMDFAGGCQGQLIRDIFGNPFRPVVLDPSWLTTTVAALAKQMYESRDFSTMPILADALQDAGCENAEVLDHCRGLGPHVRGCFVVDLLLRKE